MNSKQTLCITGASSGIGLSITQYFIKNDAIKIIATGRRSTPPPELNHPNITYIPCDLADRSSTEDFIQQTNQLCMDTGLAGLILNAAIYQPTSVDDPHFPKLLEQHLHINTIAPITLVHGLANVLKKAQGTIISISSTLGLKPFPGTLDYGISKQALQFFTQGIAREWASFGVRAFAIAPGVVDTPIHAVAHPDNEKRSEFLDTMAKLHPLGRIGQTNDLNPMIELLLDKEKSSWLTGNIIPLDGGMHLC